MARNKYVLDTSALFALIEEEEGADRVEEIIRTETASLPWAVLLHKDPEYEALVEEVELEALPYKGR